jgi:hypothetical protein
LSQTYQLSGQASRESIELDPKNLLWQHRPAKRLSGEAIRDSLLFISNDLDDQMYGNSVPIHLTPFMDGRGRPAASGPLDGDRRRSIYVAVRRNFLSPFMLTFDTPNPFSTMGRRNVSNVPSQSLILMNDPFVRLQAEHWAKNILSKSGSGGSGISSDEMEIQDRVSHMFESAFARLPSPEEIALSRKFITEQAASRNVNESDLSLWSDYAHGLINSKEFIFIR